MSAPLNRHEVWRVRGLRKPKEKGKRMHQHTAEGEPFVLLVSTPYLSMSVYDDVMPVALRELEYWQAQVTSVEWLGTSVSFFP